MELLPAGRCDPVRVTFAGAWFRPPDGGAGSLLRLADGIPEEAVRRIRDVGVPGLLPIGNVVVERGGVWLRTPQPPGPAVDDLLTRTSGLGTDDAVAVLGTVGRALRSLHTRGLCHGRVDGGAVLLDPDGVPVLVMVEAGTGGPGRDADDIGGLAWALADAWCGDAEGERLRRFANLAVTAGLDVALGALPRPALRRGAIRREAARAWAAPRPAHGVPRSADPAPHRSSTS